MTKVDDSALDGTALYCDLSVPQFADVPFYREKIKQRVAKSVLDLGCGTGRVLLRLMDDCERLYGIDINAAYVDALRSKLEQSARPSRVEVKVGDITGLDLGEKFDLVIAPYRVFQVLADDAEVDGFFQSVRQHLGRTGRAVVNSFNPRLDRTTLLRRWSTSRERTHWEKTLPDGSRAVSSVVTRCVRENPLVLCLDLIWRRYHGEQLLDEVVKPTQVRCYYPDELISTVESHGFRILEKWGGYAGERYGAGSELVVVFS